MENITHFYEKIYARLLLILLSDPGVSIEVKRQRLSRTESDAEVEYTYPINPENKSFLLIIDQFTQQREGIILSDL